MEHILKLPAGFMNDWGSGKVRKIVNDCSASTETYLAHIWPDKAGMIFTPLGLIVLLLFFDWRLGILCLVPVGIAFIFMAGMMGDDMKAAMKEYQNSLETMSSEAVEYIRGVPVVKTFGQTIFSFERFRKAMDHCLHQKHAPAYAAFYHCDQRYFRHYHCLRYCSRSQRPHAPTHIKPDLLYHYHSCDHNHLK